MQNSNKYEFCDMYCICELFYESISRMGCFLFLYRKLREMVIAYKNDATLAVKSLGMKLSGIVDAAVMGGVGNYEKVGVVYSLNMN